MGAKTLSTSLTLNLTGTYNHALDLSTVKDSLPIRETDTLATGTSADQADLLFHDERTLNATSENLDLADLTDGHQETITIEKIKAIYVRVVTTTTLHTLTMGGATASAVASLFGATTDKHIIGPNGIYLNWNPGDGWAVNTATAKLLRMDAGTHTVVYQIALWGASA